MERMGKKIWYIPDMYWPEITSPGNYVSHESICVLNPSDDDCEVQIELYYEDREPIKGLSAVCLKRRTNHIRMDKIYDECGSNIPRGIPYAGVVKSNIPIVVQYTRVDTTQEANALMTTMGF